MRRRTGGALACRVPLVAPPVVIRLLWVPTSVQWAPRAPHHCRLSIDDVSVRLRCRSA